MINIILRTLAGASLIVVGCSRSSLDQNVDRGLSEQASTSASVAESESEPSPAQQVKLTENVPADTTKLNAPAMAEECRFHQVPSWKEQPYLTTPLVGRIDFSLEIQATTNELPRGKCILELSNEREQISRSAELHDLLASSSNDDERKLHYRWNVFGLMPNTTYDATLRFEIEKFRSDLPETQFKIATPAVSPLFPEFQVRTADMERMEPGLTLFNLIRWENNKPNTDFGAIVALDSVGNIRWFYQADHLIFVVRQLTNGHLLYGYGNRTDGLIEIDLTGRLIRRWDAANLGRTVATGAIPVKVDSLHHDVFPVDSQTFLALSTSLHSVEPYYDPSYHPRKRVPQANIIADEIIELRTDGTVTRRWSLFDLLDPRRIGYGSLHHFWNQRGYEHVAGGTFDWSHANSVTIDPIDGGIIVSVRHQDAVIKIDPTRGELLWILGNPQGWRGSHSRKLLKPIGRPQWPFHQHAAEVTPHGTLLLFDNGNYQSMPFDQRLPAEENQSRVVEFLIDQDALTVEQVWEYRGEPGQSFYSTFLCDADWLPQTGNILVTNGGEIRDEQGRRTDAAPGDDQWAEIFEVTHTTPAARVFDLLVRSQDSSIGWSIYRSERINDFFRAVKVIQHP